ncbi:C40 family peptidase [Streptomyces sp. NPDC059467]|uniref:C40 family peptidase n=1 Tax=Streptomyces sp. NPDC059467 TaxID=3346844 RepID=UPI0036B8FBEE
MASESRDEVRQRINNLYDQAENATGNYNATRAMSGGSRSRGVPLFKRQRRDDPGLDNIAREWFEGARTKLGPSVPAALPTDRMPDRSGPRRPVSAMAADLLSQLEDSNPSRLALPAGTSGQSDIEVVRELPAERPKLELTAGPSAVLPPGSPSAPAPKAPSSAVPQRHAPGTSKTKSQLKVAKARELLSQRTGQRAVAALDPAPAAQPAPMPQPAQVAQPAPVAQSPWPTPEPQMQAPAQLWQAPPVGIPAQRTDSGSFRTDALTGTGAFPTVTAADTGARVMSPGSTGTFPAVPPMDMGAAPAPNPMDTGTFRVMTPGAATAPAPSPADTGGFRVMTPGSTGSFPAVPPMDMGTAPAPNPADTGTFRVMTPGASTAYAPIPDANAGAAQAEALAATAVIPAQNPMDTGTFRVMTPGAPTAPAAYAAAPPAAAGPAYATGTYTMGAPAAAPMPQMAPMPPVDAYAAQPAPAPNAYPGSAQPAATAYAAPMTAPADPMAMAAATMAPASAPAGMPAAMTMAMPAAPAAMAAMTMAPAPAPAAMAMNMAVGTMAPAPAAMPVAPPAAPAAMPVAAAPLPPVADPLYATGTFAPPGTFVDTGALPQPGAVPEPGKAMKALAFARAQIGRPCVWGATGPESYDCSSLTQAAWRAAGVTLPRTAPEQTFAGTPMTLAAIEPGDLIFFFDNDSHVGIYAGGGTMIHAPSPGATIREESIYNAGESAIHRVVRPA